LEHDVNAEPALEMLQMKSTKIVEEDEDAEEANVDDDEELDLEDDDEADVEDDDEADAKIAADSTDDDDEDESDVEWGSLDESMTWPTGPLESADKYCKRGRKTSCSSPRGWLRLELSLAKCSDKCTNSRSCKKFYYNSETMHCGVCSKCDAGIASQKNQEGYSVYKKWVLTFPFKGLCKEKHSSEKGMGKARGCKKRAKKLGAVAFAYKGKTKKCRTWNKCSSDKKGNWYVNKVR
jgi:hypothetical protein